MTLLDTILAHGDTIIVAIVAIILGWERFRSGNSSLKKEIAAEYKERKEQLDVKIQELEEKHNQTLQELAGIRATILEKDARIKELREDLQGRNPDVLNLLKKISESNILLMDFMKVIHDTLLESKKELHLQTGMLETSEKRTDIIDKAKKS